MKKTLIFFALIISVFAKVEAKADFKNGYIITLTNDTIYGKIANTSYYTHSIKCTFIENNKDEATTYFPNQLTGYRFIDGKFYLSKKVLVDSIPTPFFMEYLINAKLNFYFRQDKGLTNHYYTEKDSSGIRELVYRNEIVHNNDGDFNIEKKKYVGLLTVLTSDCQPIQNEIVRINEPDHGKLIKFAKKYHDLTCFDNACIIYEKKMPLKIKIEALTSSDFLIYTGKYLYQSYGLNMLFSNTKISEKAYIGLGVLYSPIYGEKFDSFATSPLRIPLSINYINSRSGFSPIFSVALDLNTFGYFQYFNAGVKYQINKISFNLTARLSTVSFLPYNAGFKLGLMYDL